MGRTESESYMVSFQLYKEDLSWSPQRTVNAIKSHASQSKEVRHPLLSSSSLKNMKPHFARSDGLSDFQNFRNIK